MSSPPLNEATLAELIIQLDFLTRTPPNKWEKNIPGLPVEEILNICSQVWEVETSCFQGRFNHKSKIDRIRKFSFLWACYFYGNYNFFETGDHIFCSWSLRIKSISYFFDELIANSKFSLFLLKLLLVLNQQTKNRIWKLCRPGLDQLPGVKKSHIYCNLTSYQIKQIPLRTIDWYKSQNYLDTILIYHSQMENQCKRIPMIGVEDCIVIYGMQSQGYRFIGETEVDAYKKFHPLCDRCIHKNQCSDRPIKLQVALKFSQKFRSSSICFEELPDHVPKIDIALLCPLQIDRLQ